MSISFYDVKTRESVDVQDGDVSKTKYERTTKDGKVQVRYALRGSYQGRNLTKFVSQSTWDSFSGPIV